VKEIGKNNNIISAYLNQTLILPLKIVVNEFYCALQVTNIKAYRSAQIAHMVADKNLKPRCDDTMGNATQAQLRPLVG